MEMNDAEMHTGHEKFCLARRKPAEAWLACWIRETATDGTLEKDGKSSLWETLWRAKEQEGT